MSMPVIAAPAKPINMCQAITDLLESIALEETALSHILNAEGEKIQHVLQMECLTFEQIMEVNENVMNMVNTINDIEHTLKEKLEYISNNLYYPSRESGSV